MTKVLATEVKTRQNEKRQNDFFETPVNQMTADKKTVAKITR